MYKLILFDFFGVIRTDAYKAWLSRNDYPYEGHFREASRQMDTGIIDGKGFLQQLSDLTGQSPQDIYNEMESAVSVDIKVIKLIKNLKNSYKLGLLSNASSSFLHEQLNSIGVSEYFDAIFASSDLRMAKPSPEIFHYALNQFDATPNQTIFIDDNFTNVSAAEELGITSILFIDAAQLKKRLIKLGIQVLWFCGFWVPVRILTIVWHPRIIFMHNDIFNVKALFKGSVFSIFLGLFLGNILGA